MNLRRWCVILLLGATVALGSRLSFQEHAAVQESLARMPARFQAEWLQRHGLDASRYNDYRRPETTGLRLVGKWGRGPSNEVTGRGNLVALTLGSEVALLDFARPDSPVVLSEIQFSFIPRQAALHDSFLLVGGNGIEVWSIADSTRPVFCNVVTHAVSDFAIFDTLLYFSSAGTFHAYSIGDAANPYELGTCVDSGDVVTATRNVAVAREPSSYVLGFMDVSDPTSPHRVGTYGAACLGADARGSICVVSKWWNGLDDRFWVDVIDISDPSNPRRLGEADSVGGYDIHLSGPLAFASGYNYGWGFAILDISDSTRPRIVSQTMTPNDRFAVWADWTSDWAYVADAKGLVVMNISNISSPRYDTTVMSAHCAWDIRLDEGRAHVADGGAGLRILDVTNAAIPTELGGIDSASIHALNTSTAVVRDSFAFVGWVTHPWLRVVDISDPRDPRKVGTCDLFNPAEDIVWRDSFLYVAEIARLQVVNVARPRQPVLVGSCATRDLTWAGLCLRGNTAYVAGPYDGLHIIDVTDPQNPSPVKVLGGISTWGCFVRDSLLFVSNFDDSLHIFNIANLYNVFQLGAVYVSGAGSDVEVLGDYAYVGAKGLGLVNVSNPHNPVLVDYYSTPDNVMRIVCDSPYVYAACYGGGVCIFETTQVGIQEPSRRAKQSAKFVPTIIRGAEWKAFTDGSAEVFDAMERRATQAKPGVYFVVEEPQASSHKLQAVRKVILVQ
jgi:hypothetical protein